MCGWFLPGGFLVDGRLVGGFLSGEFLWCCGSVEELFQGVLIHFLGEDFVGWFRLAEGADTGERQVIDLARGEEIAAHGVYVKDAAGVDAVGVMLGHGAAPAVCPW